MALAAPLGWLRAEDGATLQIGGDWTLANALELASAVARAAAARPADRYRIDARHVTAFDTTGALLLLRAVGHDAPTFDTADIQGMSAANIALLRLVAERRGHPSVPALSTPA
jgi:ABC-type transporter Mla MlaB component